MDIILIHGMGRTPLSMLLLRRRLKAKGFTPRLFGYSPTLESFAGCVGRLASYIGKTAADGRPYALVGHSLGTVLIRGVLPRLACPPVACFFLAPPSVACKAARFFAGNPLYKLLMGEMGQSLADAAFMADLPPPLPNTWIYAGTKGWPGGFSPFGAEPNDGILAVAETQAPQAPPPIPVPATHTFIMNAHEVAEGIADTLAELR